MTGRLRSSGPRIPFRASRQSVGSHPRSWIRWPPKLSIGDTTRFLLRKKTEKVLIIHRGRCLVFLMSLTNFSGSDWMKKLVAQARKGKVQDGMVLAVLGASVLICCLWIHWAMTAAR